MSHERRRQSIVPALIIVLTMFVVTLAVNLQLPLYQQYAELAGYEQGRISITFAAYVLGLVPALLLVGGLVGRIGGQRVLLLGLALSLASHFALIVSPNIQTLLVVRVLQGLSVGFSLSAGTSYLASGLVGAPQAARLTGVVVALGLGSGALITTLSLGANRTLVPPSYHAAAGAAVACFCAVLGLPNPRPTPGQPLLRWPLFTRRTLSAGVAIFLCWSVTGIILATAPRELALLGEEGFNGPLVFAAIALGAIIQVGPPPRDPIRFMRVGYAFVGAALLLLTAAVHQRSLVLLILASALSACSSFGFTYVGGMTHSLLACPDEPERALAGFYICGYSGLAFAPIVVGFFCDRYGLPVAMTTYTTAVGAACVLWRLVNRFERDRRGPDRLARRGALRRFGAASAELDPTRSSERPS